MTCPRWRSTWCACGVLCHCCQQLHSHIPGWATLQDDGCRRVSSTAMLLLLDTSCAWISTCFSQSVAGAQVGDIKEVQEKADKMVRWATCSRASPCTNTTASITMHS